MLRFCTGRAAGYVGYGSSGTRMVIDEANGNVGIGTTAPTRVLQVNGAAHATSHLVGSLTTALGIAGSFPDANDSELGPGYLVMTRDDTAAAKQLQFWKNGSLHSGVTTDTNGFNIFAHPGGVTDVTVNSSGYLVVHGPEHQYTSPTHTLTVGSVGNANGIALHGRNNGAEDAGTLSFLHFNSTTAHGYIQGNTGTLRFGTGATLAMTIDSSQRVGIGTTAPSAVLTTRGSSGILFNVLQGTTTRFSYDVAAGFTMNDHIDMGGNQKIKSSSAYIIIDDVSDNLALESHASGSIVLQSVGGGSVGIGTTAPADNLHLQSGGKFRNGHGVDYSGNTFIAHNTTKNYTIAAMAYGTAEFHIGLYGGGAAVNVHVTLGGHMSSGSKIYCATVLANEKVGNATVTLSENNGSYVVGIGQTSGGTIYGSFWFKASTYTDGAGVATLTAS
jgi:hypothetical protein